MLEINEEQLDRLLEKLVTEPSVEWILQYQYKDGDVQVIHTRLNNYVVRTNDTQVIISDPANTGHAVYLKADMLEYYHLYPRNTFIDSVRCGRFIRVNPKSE